MTQPIEGETLFLALFLSLEELRGGRGCNGSIEASGEALKYLKNKKGAYKKTPFAV